MISHCADTECQFYNPNGCTADEIYHTADRFCVTGHKKQVDDYKQMMKPIAGICQKDHGAMKRKR
jgi:hypothetical protein